MTFAERLEVLRFLYSGGEDEPLLTREQFLVLLDAACQGCWGDP